jgi:ribose transport system substrate-binding protein
VPFKIAALTKNLTNPAYSAARLGAERAAAQFGVRVEHYVPATPDDPEQQSALIDEALDGAPDAIILSPVHATLVNPAIERIRLSGIPLFAFVNPVDAAPCISYVGSDDRLLGFDISRYLFRHLNKQGRILVMSGHTHSITSEARLRGIEQAAREHAGIELAATLPGDYSRAIARDACAEWLLQNETPDGVIAANDIMAIGVLDALRAANKQSMVVGVNAIPQAVTEIRRGGMLATADFNAMQIAYLVAECAARHLLGETVPKEIQLPVQIVDRNNCHLWDLPYEQRAVIKLEEVCR